ncbi:type IV secretion system protein VirB5 [Altererythrobacter sp. RZ02]|uniref:Type IV secretion system protein VirB5 n=2 Tax=Sphingomonadales TaxID=204457 RepID=A0A848QNV4_9SPHN|nr:type IV secretion system protein [Pontixanthobacter rizhaonensis]NMW31236.1 type IV secretion system protein VirB5 [Pontixanthobacter rizhaonensis]
MKKLTQILSATLLFAAPLPAFAQGMPVHDSAGLIQQINTVRQTLEMVKQGKEQIAEAQRLYEDLNKLTDIPALAQQLKTDALRELDTSNASLEGFGNGDLNVVGAGRAKADEVYRGLLDRLGLAGSEQSRAAFDLNARNIGINAGLAENVGSAVTSRAQGLDQLRTRLATASTAKEVADLTARLQLESAAMQNDQLRLQAIALQQQAQERARAAEGQAALAQKLDEASRYYRGQ